MPDLTTSYDRPVKATLHVHLDNGDTFPATADDLTKFGLVNRSDAYAKFDETMTTILTAAGLLEDGELVSATLNRVRYLVEMCICNPQLLTHPEMVDTFNHIAKIERVLQDSSYDPDEELTE
jgi:hypothetical protein